MDALGLLVLAYGTPSREDEIEPYYRDIRGGQAPPPELLDELRARYRAIGGRSPLTEITERQARALAAALERRGLGEVRPYVGMKHWHPRIEAAVRAMAADGVRQAVAIVMAPQYSARSVGEYAERIEEARRGVDGAPAVTLVPSWHDEPAFLDVLAERVRGALDRLGAPAAGPDAASVIFTAHSLPASIVAEGDPYPAQLDAMARAVADRAGLSRWSTAYQSAGRRAVPWLGPDVLEQMRDEAARGARAIVVCPAGFVADHLEVLYDIDVECAQLARELGVAFARTASLNDDPAFIEALANVLERRARGDAHA